MKVAIGLSGGVDSSVAAYLLKKQGHEVIALYMKNWEDLDGSCTAKEDLQDVASVCNQLNIPFYTINFVKEYKEEVFDQFLKECREGLTPNPDILCNQKIKFHHFYNKAKQLDVDAIATGHYCQIQNHQLVKGADPNKDQSYFLSAISSDVLDEVFFPIGHLQKSEVRKIAKENQFVTCDKKDSTGICFIGKRNFKQFVSQYLGFSKGNIIDTTGKILGVHDGLSYHTIGQRKGLNIGGEGEAWYVVGKDLEKNLLIVGQGKDHPSLFSSHVEATRMNWFQKPTELPYSCKAKVRYRQLDQECTILSIEPNRLVAHFKQPQRAVTPGQSIVFYQDDICLGGAQIQKTF